MRLGVNWITYIDVVDIFKIVVLLCTKRFEALQAFGDNEDMSVKYSVLNWVDKFSSLEIELRHSLHLFLYHIIGEKKIKHMLLYI